MGAASERMEAPEATAATAATATVRTEKALTMVVVEVVTDWLVRWLVAGCGERELNNELE
jgi:hypothetical protein